MCVYGSVCPATDAGSAAIICGSIVSPGLGSPCCGLRDLLRDLADPVVTYRGCWELEVKGHTPGVRVHARKTTCCGQPLVLFTHTYLRLLNIFYLPPEISQSKKIKRILEIEPLRYWWLIWPIQNDAKKLLKRMNETLAHRYSYESAQQELSNEYQHDRV